MVHTAAGYAKATNRRRDARLHVVDRARARRTWSPARRSRRSTGCPCCCCPSDYYATRCQGPVLQQLEHPVSLDVSVNDCFRPVSRFFDRITRPEQLLESLPEAMRVLTDPAETGAVTIALPQDIQAEAYDYPGALLRAAACGRSSGGRRRRARSGRPSSCCAGRAAVHHRRRRRPLLRGLGRAAELRRGVRHPGRRDLRRQGRVPRRLAAAARRRRA